MGKCKLGELPLLEAHIKIQKTHNPNQKEKTIEPPLFSFFRKEGLELSWRKSSYNTQFELEIVIFSQTRRNGIILRGQAEKIQKYAFWARFLA